MRPFAHPTGYVESMSDRITARRFHESEGVEDWRVVGEGACAYFRPGRSAAATGSGKQSTGLPGPITTTPVSALRTAAGIGRWIPVGPDNYGLSGRALERPRR